MDDVGSVAGGAAAVPEGGDVFGVIEVGGLPETFRERFVARGAGRDVALHRLEFGEVNAAGFAQAEHLFLCSIGPNDTNLVGHGRRSDADDLVGERNLFTFPLKDSKGGVIFVETHDGFPSLAVGFGVENVASARISLGNHYQFGSRRYSRSRRVVDCDAQWRCSNESVPSNDAY